MLGANFSTKHVCTKFDRREKLLSKTRLKYIPVEKLTTKPVENGENNCNTLWIRITSPVRLARGGCPETLEDIHGLVGN